MRIRILKVSVVVGIVAALTWNAPSLAQGGKDEKIVVRALKFTPKDPTTVFSIGGQSKVTTCTAAAAVEKLVGKRSAKPLIDLVDFDKESIVLVSWTTGGPSDGSLMHEINGAGKNHKLTFFVQGPLGARTRGQRARIGADFFAVPKGVTVTFDPNER